MVPSAQVEAQGGGRVKSKHCCCICHSCKSLLSQHQIMPKSLKNRMVQTWISLCLIHERVVSTGAFHVSLKDPHYKIKDAQKQRDWMYIKMKYNRSRTHYLSNVKKKQSQKNELITFYVIVPISGSSRSLYATDCSFKSVMFSKTPSKPCLEVE